MVVSKRPFKNGRCGESDERPMDAILTSISDLFTFLHSSVVKYRGKMIKMSKKWQTSEKAEAPLSFSMKKAHQSVRPSIVFLSEGGKPLEMGRTPFIIYITPPTTGRKVSLDHQYWMCRMLQHLRLRTPQCDDWNSQVKNPNCHESSSLLAADCCHR